MRRQTVLDYMLEQGYITQEAYDEAVADDVYSRIQETDSQTEETSIYTYYVDAMIDQIIQDLMEQKGYTEQQANKILFTKGLKIYSVQDMAIQKICDEEFSNLAQFPLGNPGGRGLCPQRPDHGRRNDPLWKRRFPLLVSPEL